MGIRNWYAVARGCKEWRRIALEGELHNGLGAAEVAVTLCPPQISHGISESNPVLRR